MVMNAGIPICGTVEAYCNSKVLRTSCDTRNSVRVSGDVTIDVGGVQSDMGSPIRDRRTITLDKPFDCKEFQLEEYAEAFGEKVNGTLKSRTVQDEKNSERQELDPGLVFGGLTAFTKDEGRGPSLVSVCNTCTFNFPSACSNTISFTGEDCVTKDDLGEYANAGSEEEDEDEEEEEEEEEENAGGGADEEEDEDEDEEQSLLEVEGVGDNTLGKRKIGVPEKNSARQEELGVQEDDSMDDPDENEDDDFEGFQEDDKAEPKSPEQLQKDMMSAALFPDEQIVVNTTLTSRVESCAAKGKHAILRLQRRSPFSRQAEITFHGSIFSKGHEMVSEQVRFITGSHYAETTADLCANFYPGDRIATLDLGFKSMIAECTSTKIEMQEPYTGSQGDIVESKLGVLRQWAMPGKVIGEGIVVDVSDDTEQDTGDNGTMTILPKSGDPKDFCALLLKGLGGFRKTSGPLADKRPVTRDLLRMKSVFSAKVVEVDYEAQEARLSRQYCGDEMTGVQLYRFRPRPEPTAPKDPCPPLGGTLLPGTFCAGNGSNILVSTKDLRKHVFAADAILIGGLKCVAETIGSGKIEVKCPTLIDGYYMSTQTGCGLTACVQKKNADDPVIMAQELSKRIFDSKTVKETAHAEDVLCEHLKSHNMTRPNFCSKPHLIEIYVIHSAGNKKKYSVYKTSKVKEVIDALVGPEEKSLERGELLLQKTQGDKAALTIENRTLASYKVDDEDVLQVVSNETKAGFFT
jgi:hypothetical protein